MPTLDIAHDFAAVPRAEWEDLVTSCPDSTVFQCYEYLFSWWETHRTPDMQLLLITARERGVLVGLAPIYRRVLSASAEGAAELGLLGHGHTDYQVFPARHGRVDVVNALLDEVQKLLGPRCTARLPEVPQFSALALCLNDRIVSHWHGVRLSGRTPCPRLRLRDNAPNAARLLRKQSVRRNKRELGAAGAVSITHHQDVDTISLHLPELFAQHERRWAGTPHPSLFLLERNRRFYQRLTELLAPRGWLVLSVLRVADRTAAMHFGLISGRDLFWYKPSFDINLAQCSPGEVMLANLIEYALDHDYDTLDFTRGDEPFKRRFATSVEWNNSYEWAAPSWRETSRRALSGSRRWAGRTLRELRSRPRAPSGVVGDIYIIHGDGSRAAGRAATVFGIANATTHVCEFNRSSPAEGPGGVIALLRADLVKARPALVVLIAVDRSLALAISGDPVLGPLALLPSAPTIASQEHAALTESTHPAVSIRVECLCDHGRLIGHFCYRVAAGVANFDGCSSTDAVEAVLRARLTLESSRWHGWAIVDLSIGNDGQMHAIGITPGTIHALTTMNHGAREFALACWRLACDEPAAPYVVPVVQDARRS